jgi:hypothetical protein
MRKRTSGELWLISGAFFSVGYVAQWVLATIFPIPANIIESYLPGAPWWAAFIAFILPTLGLITFVVGLVRSRRHG